MGEWFRDASKRNIPINTKIIKEKALSMALELGYSHFHASNGWLDKWRKRNNIGHDFSYSECTESERRCNDLEDLRLVTGFSQGWEPAEQQQQQAQQISISSEAVGDTELEGSRLTIQAVCEDEAPAAKKRKRNSEKQQPLYVSLDREIVDSWNCIGIKEGLSSHAEIANFLISLYMHNQASGKTKKKTVKSGMMPGGVCSGCQGPLTLNISCASCHSASYVSGSQREIQTTSYTSGSQLYPEPPVVDPVSPLSLTCESSNSCQGPSQTVESLQPSESGLSSLHPERSQPSPASENQPFLVYPDFPEEVAVKTEDVLEREMPKGKTHLGLSTPQVFMVRSERALDLQNFEIAEIKTEPELHDDSSGSDVPVRLVKSKAKAYKESGHCKAKGNDPQSVVDCVPIESLEAELAMQEKNQSASERSLQKMKIKVEECSDEESL
ncbi:hypothetical protein V1264_006648 [Littorina saxatilis]|uniref:HTH CENPB-type domain-containing protein n=2 Tax=Littorina saxatilis TaxID=31220 RepID=A0AAN9AXI1_9CAEN